MAWSLQWYRNSVLAWLWNEEAQQAIQSETPWFNMFSNVNTSNVPWMDILDPVSRQRQEYDQNEMRIQALNKEVETWLWTRIDDVMSDTEKQNYLNHLSKYQYEQMLKYKNEWYGFMASKALLENQYKLADTDATWLMKYKDYAEKDAYYNNSLIDTTDPQDTPTSQLADWWNERYSKNVQYGTNEKWETYVIRDDNNFWNRLANVSFGSLVNLLDTWVTGMMSIMDKWESALWSVLDKAILWYDTDADFYRKSDSTLINDVAQTVWSAASLALLWAWTVASPWWMAWMTAIGATKPWGFALDLTFGNLDRLINWTLDKVDYKDYLNNQSLDSLSNAITLGIAIWLSKHGWAKLKNTKIWGYATTIKWMVKNWIQRWVEYGKVQEWFERFKWTKNTPYVDIETWETWTIPEFEWYEPWYRGRIAKEVWEWFKEGVREKMFPTQETTLSEWGSTVYQEGIPWTEQTSWVSEGVKTDTNGTQTNWIVNRIWTAQLRQWNKMNKNQAIKFSNKYGTDYGTWLAARWFNQAYDNNINALTSYADYVQGQKSDALWAMTQRYRDARVDDMLLEAIEKAEYTKSPDLWKLEAIWLKNQQGGLTLQDVDWVRQWFWYNLPLRFDGTDVSGTVARNNNMYTAVREFLEEKSAENWFPQLRELNREIAATHHIIEATTRYYNGIATNDTVSLKDLVTLAWAMANPSAWPLFFLQQALKSTKVQDRILNKLIKGKTNSERNQIKIDLEKIKKIQDEAEQRRLLEEWIAKWNLKVEEATKAMQNRLPETIQGGGVVAWDTWFPTTNPTSPTYQELWRGNIRETYSPQFLLKAMIQQLVDMKMVEWLDTARAVDYIMANLSPEAKAKLAEISQKLWSWQPLTEEEWAIIEKLADVIMKEQWNIGESWLDNWEPTGYTPTDLPTNPTNNGGITEWGNPWEWGEPWRWGDNIGQWGTDWGGYEGVLWENGWGLWKSESWIWEGEKVVEITDVNEYVDIIKKLLKLDEQWKTLNAWDIDDFDTYKTLSNPERSVLVGVDWDWKIVEFIRSEDAPQWAADELIFRAIEEGGDKIEVNSAAQVEFFEKFWFKPVAWTRKWGENLYFMAHNWDPIDVVRNNMWKYEHNSKLWKLKWMTYESWEKYVKDMLDDTYTYKFDDIEWWKWKQNYDTFNEKFKTNAEIRDYIKEKYRSLRGEALPEDENAYNRELAETREIWNWHIDTTDIGVRYFVGKKALQKHYHKWRNTNAVFDREKVDISIWVSEWYSVSHEAAHWYDYKLWKEITWKDVRLTDLAERIINQRLKRPEIVSNEIADLVWDFVDLYKRIKKWWYDWYRSKSYPNYKTATWRNWKYANKPTERFARRWEAFVKAVRGGEPTGTAMEQFTKWLAMDFAKWLWKVDTVRQKWMLSDWKLNPINDTEWTTVDIPDVWHIWWIEEFVKN